MTAGRRCAGLGLLIMALLAVLPMPAQAQSSLPPPVAKALAQAKIPESATAFYVREIDAARPILAAGAGRAMNPASVIKLVTTYASLELLGPAYAWQTEAYATGPVAQEVLNGDLVLKGAGDPKLTLENFWLLLRELRGRGVREIRGDLVLDRSLFAPGEFDSARFDDQPTRPYNTGPDALLVNYKSIRLQFVPEPEARAVRIVAEPALPQIEIVNQLTLDGAPCGDWVSRLKLDAQGSATGARLQFSGAYSRDCGERARHFSVLGHREYVLALFTQLWRELGGAFAGSVRDGTAPADARLLASLKSPSLSEIVRDVNKFSNNVMARHLYLALGTNEGGPPATPDKSFRAVRRWLSGRGLDFPELVLENGSGLSRIERISAASLGQMLIAAFRSAVMPELMASLPVAAVDGTMRKRLAGADIAGQAHIKTGSLAGVRTIGGYVLDSQGRRLVVVMFVNHANAGNAQPVQDALLRWVYNRGNQNQSK
ncbi:MAG: D-alanyl-D-alanine carboxypeptidase/D-alanyl-D-alanine-endopeptidase [Burkholderiales bacterium]|nr:D-alanyl-D-alanine carboxypeptidase/D-alanyl-D-alanine-endopeptidase [Burkholderiales bacterium]